VDFEWDDLKAEINFRKHSVRFSEAASSWLDSNALEMPDTDHSELEERWVRIGLSHTMRVLVVVYVEKIEGERVRIISARKANRFENGQYHWR
jgi:uncharacterized protein